MAIVDKSKPDVLRVMEYVSDKAKEKEAFSVCSAIASSELNGIGDYQVSEIMRDICLDPQDKGSLFKYTTIDNTNIHNTFCHWQLNVNSYTSYLAYQSVLESQKSNHIAVKALKVAIVAVFISFVAVLVAA